MIFLSKVCTHLMTTSIPCLFASLCAGIVTGQTVGDWLLVLLMPQSAILLSAVAGLAINLSMPRLTWVNEINVVKQGAAAMISLFGAMLVSILTAAGYLILLRRILSLDAFLWILTLIFAGIAAIISLRLVKTGVRQFEKL